MKALSWSFGILELSSSWSILQSCYLYKHPKSIQKMTQVGTMAQMSNGVSIPSVGLGVYKSQAGAETYNAVISAIKLGYRHIDTAQVYSNEADVGRAVKDCGVPRSELFVTTKLWRSYWGYDKAKLAVQESLKKLGLDYVDLFLLHCPGDPGPRAETWRALEDAQKQGLTRSIGVSNFGKPHLDKLLLTASIRPVINQIELHPFLQRRDLVDYCKEQGILLQAARLDHPELLSVSSEKGVTVAQLLIRWSLQHGFVPLPKSVSPDRQAVNLDVFGFELDEKDMARLGALDEDLVTGWDPITTDPV